MRSIDERGPLIRATLLAVLAAAVASISLSGLSAAMASEEGGFGAVLCEASEVDILVDGSVSVEDAVFGLEVEAVVVTADELAGCVEAPDLWISAFATSTTSLEPLDVDSVLAQLVSMRAAVPVEWTDPIEAVKSVRAREDASASMNRRPTIIIMDGAIEPGPDFGPPARPDDYIGELQGLAVDAPLFLWALRSEAGPQLETGFVELWRKLADLDLGRIDYVSAAGVTLFFSVPAAQLAADLQAPASPKLLAETATSPKDVSEDSFWPNLNVGAIEEPVIEQTTLVAEPLALSIDTYDWLSIAVAFLVLWSVAAQIILGRRTKVRPYRVFQWRLHGKTGTVLIREGVHKKIPSAGANYQVVTLQSGAVFVECEGQCIRLPSSGAVALPGGGHARVIKRGTTRNEPWPTEKSSGPSWGRPVGPPSRRGVRSS